jgi:hypothetical protein
MFRSTVLSAETVLGAATATAALVAGRLFTGSISLVATASGVLSKGLTLAGTAVAALAATATAIVVRGIAGTVTAAAQATAALARIAGLSATVLVQSAVTANIGIRRALTALVSVAASATAWLAGGSVRTGTPPPAGSSVFRDTLDAGVADRDTPDAGS